MKRSARQPTLSVLATLTCVVGIGLSIPALAVDGVVEINQRRAEAGDVTPGDSPGFPVFINDPGSYRLTSDLVAPSGIGAISIKTDHVTLDLNGFSVLGGGEVGSANGVSFGAQDNVEVRNGTVRGFLGHGVFGSSFSLHARVINVRSSDNVMTGIELQGPGSLVEGCEAMGNGGRGIKVSNGSLIINSIARDNGAEGLALATDGGYRSNVVTNNNGGNLFPQVGGTGEELGPNYCGTNTVCP